MAVDVEEVLPEVEDIAKRVARDYPEVDWRDVSQHLALLLLENESLYWSDGQAVKRILRLAATGFCKRERAIQLHTTSQYDYRPSDVARILETAFNSYEAENTYVPEDAHSIKRSADSLDMASDVKMAWERLSDEDRKIIFIRYGLGVVPDNASYERKKLNKSVSKLTRLLNSYKPEPRRRALSNSKARVLIDKGY